VRERARSTEKAIRQLHLVVMHRAAYASHTTPAHDISINVRPRLMNARPGVPDPELILLTRPRAAIPAAVAGAPSLSTRPRRPRMHNTEISRGRETRRQRARMRTLYRDGRRLHLVVRPHADNETPPLGTLILRLGRPPGDRQQTARTWEQDREGDVYLLVEQSPTTISLLLPHVGRTPRSAAGR
jgi:hypothetical protein